MCFEASKPTLKARRTSVDLIAYKLLRNDGYNQKILRSPIKGSSPWKRGQIREEEAFQAVSNIVSHVDIGFHSFRTIEAAKKYRSWRDWGIYQVVIPAGSLVHRNKTQFCSNKIVLQSTRQVK